MVDEGTRHDEARSTGGRSPEAIVGILEEEEVILVKQPDLLEEFAREHHTAAGYVPGFVRDERGEILITHAYAGVAYSAQQIVDAGPGHPDDVRTCVEHHRAHRTDLLRASKVDELCHQVVIGETPDPLAGGFSVTQATVLVPTISSITPTSGPAGTTVTINGTNFRSTLGSSYVSFNGVKATS